RSRSQRHPGRHIFGKIRVTGCLRPPCKPVWTQMPASTREPHVHPDLESVLFTEEQIKKRVGELGQELRKTYGEGEFTIVSIINGAVMFTADLMREIENPVRLDCVRITSYGDKTKSVGTPQIVH